jgi:metal-responsive CopG/Arc/MetJ family transcriptional regulator
MINDSKLVIKKRGSDNSKVITIRIKENLLQRIDDISNETNYSRNELICLMLQHGVDNIEIQ